jgi:predicted phage baseplate assembly protein
VNSDDGSRWAPLEPDLLTCSPNGLYFVPEVEYDGTVYLRFGDGQYGMAPKQHVTFYANYRTGNGAVGNVGRDTLGHAVLPANWGGATTDISEVRNPLGATGGADPEDMDHIRQFAPFAYQTQLRCVTEADYGQMATQLSGGSAARGTMRWTGSWYTAFVSVDSTQLTSAAMTGLESGLRLYRMMGTDIAVEEAIIVGLEIELQIYVDPAHFQGDVYDALMAIFVSGNQCDGAEGLLNPSNFSFGQTVYASPLIAAAQGVDGVASIVMTKFTRLDTPWLNGVAVGFITLGRLEIARCDNDPDHLDHGILVLNMSGGK